MLLSLLLSNFVFVASDFTERKEEKIVSVYSLKNKIKVSYFICVSKFHSGHPVGDHTETRSVS